MQEGAGACESKASSDTLCIEMNRPDESTQRFWFGPQGLAKCAKTLRWFEKPLEHEGLFTSLRFVHIYGNLLAVPDLASSLGCKWRHNE